MSEEVTIIHEQEAKCKWHAIDLKSCIGTASFYFFGIVFIAVCLHIPSLVYMAIFSYLSICMIPVFGAGFLLFLLRYYW